jgi:hypothetical protein
MRPTLRLTLGASFICQTHRSSTGLAGSDVGVFDPPCGRESRTGPYCFRLSQAALNAGTGVTSSVRLLSIRYRLLPKKYQTETNPKSR